MPENNEYSDRRHFPRISKEASVEVSKLEYPVVQHAQHKASLRNINQSGICCVVPIPYPAGTILSLKIALKGWNQHRKGVRAIVDVTTTKAPLTVLGEVMWCKAITNGNYEIGVHLTNVYDDDLKALTHYLKTLA